MNVISENILKTIHNLKDTALNKGHVTTANCLNELIYKDAAVFCFVGEGKYNEAENNYATTIKLLGEGDITITCEDVVETRKLSKTNYTSIVIKFQDKKLRPYSINGIENITELDISDNGVCDCVFDAENKINKLVIYNNKLKKLDCSNLKCLQFLHMFNNPVCKNLTEMKKVIKSLPDRNEKPFGSIIMYDWVNLGICGHFDSQNNRFCYDKELQYPIRKYKDEIYRDINSTEHSWYQLVNAIETEKGNVEGGTFKELKDYNKLIMIRRQLEGLEGLEQPDKSKWSYTNKEGSIFKNWVFGSAIQYNKEAWKYCEYYFKKAHIADVWETAEKGEGIGITSPDQIKFTNPSINISRVYAYADLEYPTATLWGVDKYGKKIEVGGTGVQPVPRYSNSEEDTNKIESTGISWLEPGCYRLYEGIRDDSSDEDSKKEADSSFHGDTCFSLIGDRGITESEREKSIYGIAPEARYYLMNFRTSTSSAFIEGPSTENDYLKLIGKTINCDVNKICTDYNIDIGGVATSANSVLEGVNTNDINIFTRSMGSFNSATHVSKDVNNNNFHRAMCSEIFEQIYAFNSQGNSGDGFPWTSDQGTGTSDPAQWDNYRLGSKCNFVSSINTANRLSVFSSNDRSDKPYRYNYACHGEGLKMHSPLYKDTFRTASGTSGATPIHAAKTGLLLVIFSKLNNFYRFNNDKNYWYIENSTGNKDSFEPYLNSHLDPLPTILRSAVGNGTIDMLSYNIPEKHDVIYTASITKSGSFDNYTVNNLCQIVEYDNKSYINKNHYVKNDISKIIMTDRNHTLFMPLEAGTHNINIYNNDMNTITDTTATYGITDDMSEGIWYSNTSISSQDSNEFEPEEVDGGHKCESSTPLQCNNMNGWSLSLVFNYDREKNIKSKSNYDIIESDDFLVSVKISTSKNSEKVALRFTDLEKEFSINYTTAIAHDCYKNTQTNYREVGYLGMLNGKNFVFTIVKRENNNLFDFYLNGQYITSHETPFYRDAPTSSININSIGDEITDARLKFVSGTMHDRPFTDEEVVQQAAYLHHTHCKLTD